METRANNSTANTKQVRYYYTKRSRLAVPSEGQHRGSLSSRQSLPSSPCSAQFEIGAFYEINHEQLHPRSPVQLKSVRVVKICEKSSLCVTVSFPSPLSLRNFFSSLRLGSADRNKRGVEDEPEMDERYVMSSNQASKILGKQVPSSVFYQERSMDNFWLLNPVAPPTNPLRSTEKSDRRRSCNILGSCLLTLQCTDDLRWGIRRKVKYVAHRDLPLPEEVNEVSDMSEKKVARKEAVNNTREKTAETEVEEDKKVEVRAKTEMPFSRNKRREIFDSSSIKRRKRLEKEKRSRPAVRGGSEKECRWSVGRYKSAEKSLLEVMREMGVNSERPVRRHELREEARQFIGDTGLLDHLLKHMAGKVLAEGTERFVRRHNSEGTIEYWLEPAKLAEIRRQAGVTDQLWLPPPGWKPGDAVSRCTCGGAHGHTSQLKDEILAHVKREMEEQVNVKLTGQTEKTEALMQLQTVENTWKEKYERVLIQNGKLQEQITALSVSLQSVKAEMSLLKEEKEKKQDGEINQKAMALAEKEKGKQQVDDADHNGKTSEGRRSGFRICKPEGTFLWPNMAIANANPPSLTLSNNNYFNTASAGCPTPPSTSSATSAPSKLLLLPSPTSVPSPAAYSGPSNVMMNVGGRPRSRQGSEVRDETVVGTAPALESDSDDVLTDLALATLSY